MENELSVIEKYYPFILIKAISDCFKNKACKGIGDLTWTQYQFMLLIKHYTEYLNETSKGKINEIKSYPSLNTIAEEMMMSHQNAMKLVKVLRSKGFVDIVSDPDNKSMKRIKINAFGQAYINEHNEMFGLVESLLDGVTDDEVRTLIEVLSKISTNMALTDHSSIKVRTINHVEPQDFNTFKKCKIVPRLKNRPYYQLYGSRGAVLQVSGINRFILAFYDTEAAIDKEIEEIYKAIENGEREYEVKYNCEVEYDLTGLPVLKTTEE